MSVCSSQKNPNPCQKTTPHKSKIHKTESEKFVRECSSGFDVDSVVKQFESGSETCTSYVDEFDICCGITSPTPAENPTSGGVAFSGFGAFALVFIFWEVYAVRFMW